MTKNNKIFLYLAVLMIIAVGSTVLMMPRERVSEYTDYREGVPAPKSITAPFDFEILRTDDELFNVREKVKSYVIPVFDLNDTLNNHLNKKFGRFLADYDKILTVKNRLTEFSDPKTSSDSLLQETKKIYIKEKAAFNQTYGINIDELTEPPLLSDIVTRKNVGHYIKNNTEDRILDIPKKDIFNKNLGKIILRSGKEAFDVSLNDFPDIINKNRRDADFIASLYKTAGNDSAEYWKKIINNFSKPSLIFNKQLTDSLVQKVQNEVPLAEGLVKKGDELISKNTLVTKQSLNVLRSLDLKLKESGEAENSSIMYRINFKAVSGKVIISSLFYFILIFMLYFNRKKFFYSFKALTVIFLIILIQLAIVYLSFKHIDNFSPYLIPISVTSVLVSVFFDMRVAFVTAIVTSVLSSLLIGNNFLFLFIPMFSGLFTMYAVHKIRDIFQFIYKMMLFSFLGLILPAVGFYLIFNSSYSDLFSAANHSAINAVISPLLALTLLTVIERIFKMPTDITLLQLSDLSKPLLRKLQIEAPGTYHHSITVGNLAEAAAEAINANSLLARVGAYYHDIGKTFKAAYFIENQQNIPNKHDKMAPNMSAFVLSAHVKEGIKLAYENNLPEVIIDFIRMHHGASRMEYFYNKAVNLAKGTEEKVNESIYRYPGPKPNSKETAIVMISDVVEAKCRTESSANTDRFRQIISDIILDKLRSGELDECDIKLNDLSKIREAMVPVITGMYHQRIKYPAKIIEGSEPDNIEEK